MGALIVLRIVHVGFGVFWAGGVMFMNFLVGPSLAAAGPEGVRVMQEMNKRHYFGIILGAAAATIISGLDLMRRDSAGFAPSWFHSSFGIGLSAGMIAAIIAFLIGLLAVGPAMRRMTAIGETMMAAAPEARAPIAAQLNEARARLIAFSKIATLFVVSAVLAMATARYL